MLCILFIVLSIGSCHSYNVSVTVQSAFCLDMYPNDPEDSNTLSQLQLEFRVGYGAMQTESLYFETDFKVFSLINPQISFTQDDSILFGPIIPALELDKAYSLPAISPQDALDISFQIGPIQEMMADRSRVEKCTGNDRFHSHPLTPRDLLQNVPNHTFSEQIVFHLNNTPCLTTSDSWFTCKPQITVQLNFECDGPCNQLPFTTTTSTTYQVTTETTTTKANNDARDVDKFKFSLIAVAAVAALELMLIIGLCVRRRHKPTSDPVERNVVEPEMYDDVQQNVVNNVTSQRQNGRPIDVNADAEDDNYAAFAMDVIIDPAHLRSLNRNQ